MSHCPYGFVFCFWKNITSGQYFSEKVPLAQNVIGMFQYGPVAYSSNGSIYLTGNIIRKESMCNPNAQLPLSLLVCWWGLFLVIYIFTLCKVRCYSNVTVRCSIKQYLFYVYTVSIKYLCYVYTVLILCLHIVLSGIHSSLPPLFHSIHYSSLTLSNHEIPSVFVLPLGQCCYPPFFL